MHPLMNLRPSPYTLNPKLCAGARGLKQNIQDCSTRCAKMVAEKAEKAANKKAEREKKRAKKRKRADRREEDHEGG